MIVHNNVAEPLESRILHIGQLNTMTGGRIKRIKGLWVRN